MATTTDGAQKKAGDLNNLWRVERSTAAYSGVPMIPKDLSAGSERNRPGIMDNKIMFNVVSNPLVPLGALATVFCLGGMFKAVINKRSHQAQLYMRGRIAAQAFTVAALVGGALYLGHVGSRRSGQTAQQNAEQ